MTTHIEFEASQGAEDGETPSSGYTSSETPILARATPRWKRVFDLVLVACLVPVLAPFLVLIAAYIKIVSRGPALFVQERLGHGGSYFRIYKFRTMHVADKSRDEAHREYVSQLRTSKPLSKPDHRSSLILGGQILRRTSIDELPQLINVCLGNMSLVGPRPDVLHKQDYAPNQLRRFEVVPGMTGLWQVSGKNELSFEEMIELDVRYIDTQSLWQDLSIILRTVRVLISDRNE